MGDLTEVFTNGLFPATRHRVVVPAEEVLRRQARQSFVFFVHPDDETVAQPIHGQQPKDPVKYGSKITARQHLINQFAVTYV